MDSKLKKSFVGFKVCESDKNKIRQRALLYCKGNVSEYLLKAALSYSNKKGTPKSAQ